MKKMSSMVRFQKKISWRKVRIMLRFSLPMNRMAQGGAILVSIDVPRIWCICVSMNFKVLCLRMKSSIMHTIWSGGWFVGSRCLYSSRKGFMSTMLSSCRMFVYRDATSAVTRRVLG